MTSTEFHAVLRLRGEYLDPSDLTERLGIQPSNAFAVGEHRQPKSKHTAGWDWRSRSDDDPDPLITELFSLFGPRLDVLASATARGATATLTVVGQISGDVVMTAAEADRRRISWGDEGDRFEPFFDGDRFGLWLDPEVVAFLGAVPCAFATHVDAEVSRLAGDAATAPAGNPDEPDRPDRPPRNRALAALRERGERPRRVPDP